MSITLILTKKEQVNRYFLALPSRLYLVCNRIKKSWRSRSIRSLSNSVFERRTSTGSGLFAALGCGLVETLR